jgi:penicillin amidase
MPRWIKRLAVGIAALSTLAVLGAFGYAWRATPTHEGELKVQGLSGEVRIERDRHGIPTVRAGSLRDAMYGLGVVHAQDRLWQLETHRRVGSGRLAEAFGAGALDTDRFLRALGVRRAAQAQWERTSGESREVLEAYTAGVNAGIGQAAWALPPEFLVLGVKPEPWTPVDSLAWAIMMAWDLGGNWNAELARLRLASRLPLARVNQIVPPYPGDAPVRTRDYPALYAELGLRAGAQRKALVDLPDVAPASGVEGTGSNNWVVAGARSATGSPLLANDPHLRLSVPALWYFARIEAPGVKAAGATMPGLPSVVLGQNADIAWGFTNTGPDVQDLYLERVQDGDPARYVTPDGNAAFEVREETVRVKGQPELKLRLRSTRHGPVISDAGTLVDVVGERPDAAPLVLAMRWTALDPDADPIGAGLKMLRAGSVDDFVAASALWVAPMQNMVVADRAGRIGFVAAGRVPLRRPDNDLQGLAPAPGWDARYDWAGWLPAQQTPREFDPPRGWLATANQRVHGADYPHHLTHDWTLPFRQQRIEQLLESRPKHTLDDLARMQADEVSLAVAPVLAWLRAARPEHPQAAAAQAALAAWDGRMSADSAAPLIHWAWLRQLTRALFVDEVGAEDFERLFGPRTFFDAVLGVIERDDAWWCDDKTTPAVETCAALSTRAMAAALDELAQRFGPDVPAWRWGPAHATVAEHRPFSRVKALARVFELRVPVGGDTYTVNATRVTLKPHPSTGELYLNEHGASMRALYDLANPAQSRVMHSSGQSGLPWTTHYRSFLQRWAGVEYVPLWPEGADATAGGALVLKPGGR